MVMAMRGLVIGLYCKTQKRGGKPFSFRAKPEKRYAGLGDAPPAGKDKNTCLMNFGYFLIVVTLRLPFANREVVQVHAILTTFLILSFSLRLE